MSTLAHRERQGPFVDILDWFDAPWGVFRSVGDNPMRVEDFIKDGRYVLRAELPGIDPEKDLELTVSRSARTGRRKPRPSTGRSSGTASLPAASSCRPAPTRTTSRPAMTQACWKWPSTCTIRWPGSRTSGFPCGHGSTSSRPDRYRSNRVPIPRPHGRGIGLPAPAGEPPGRPASTSACWPRPSRCSPWPTATSAGGATWTKASPTDCPAVT